MTPTRPLAIVERVATLREVEPCHTARTKDEDLPGWWYVEAVRPLDEDTVAVLLRSEQLVASGWHLLPPDHKVLIELN